MRRSKVSAVARVRPFWFLIILVAIGAGAGGYWAATWPGFFPKHVWVSGNHLVTTREILARAAIESHENLWLQNTGAAAARIAKIPYVKDAQVRRIPPASAIVQVTERVPFAVMQFGDGTVLVDNDLRVLETGNGAADLPVFVASSQAVPLPGVFLKDPQVARMRDDYELLAQDHVAAAQLRFDRFDDLIVQMRNGVQLLLGDDDDLATKAALVGPILSQVGAQGKKISAVDLRAPKTPVVRYAASAP